MPPLLWGREPQIVAFVTPLAFSLLLFAYFCIYPSPNFKLYLRLSPAHAGLLIRQNNKLTRPFPSNAHTRSRCAGGGGTDVNEGKGRSLVFPLIILGEM